MPATVFSPGWTPSADALRRGGAALLWVGLALLLALLLLMLWVAPDLLPAFPAALLGGAALVYLLGRPTHHLYAVLLASASILQHEPGVQVTEVVYGLYVLFFLGVWFLGEVLAGRRPLRSGEARLLTCFLAYVALLVPVSFALGGTSHTVVRELTSLAFLGFFFPIREVCVREPNGVRRLVWIGIALGLFVVTRNLMHYQAGLQSAERLGEMITERVIANDHVLTASSLLSLVFLLYARTVRTAVSAGALFMLSFSGLLLTFSRGFWLAFVWGVLFVVWVVDWTQRVRIVVAGGLVSVTLLGVGMVFFGNLVDLFFGSILSRLTSVQGSVTSDISMLGRIYESRAAMEHIVSNPVMGHGVGVPFTFSTILTRAQLSTTFIHNGYVYLWYAFGLPGAVMMLTLWWRAIRRATRVFRAEASTRLERTAGLGVAASLFAFTLSASTSNPFWHKDYLLGLAFLFGLAYGMYARVHPAAD